MIRFRIRELMEERGMKKPRIKPFVQRGISFDIMKRYLNGTKEDMGRDHMEIFCSVLRCTPNDLHEWVPDPNNPLDEHHPLHQLKPREHFNVEEELKNLTPGEIRELFEKRKKNQDEGKK